MTQWGLGYSPFTRIRIFCSPWYPDKPDSQLTQQLFGSVVLNLWMMPGRGHLQKDGHLQGAAAAIRACRALAQRWLLVFLLDAGAPSSRGNLGPSRTRRLHRSSSSSSPRRRPREERRGDWLHTRAHTPSAQHEKQNAEHDKDKEDKTSRTHHRLCLPRHDIRRPSLSSLDPCVEHHGLRLSRFARHPPLPSEPPPRSPPPPIRPPQPRALILTLSPLLVAAAATPRSEQCREVVPSEDGIRPGARAAAPRA